MKDLIMGIDVGGTTIKIGLIKDQGEILKQWSIATNKANQGSRIVPDIIESIQAQLKSMAIDHTTIRGIGMGSPGAVDRNMGTVSGAYNLNWENTQPIKARFEDAFGLPFYLDNDANVAALGEKWQGSGDNLANVVFITLGTGVGGGIVVHNDLVTGTHGCAGEIGHLHVTDNPVFQCTCGNQGCLESVASATGMLHLSKDLAQKFSEKSALKKKILSESTLMVKEVFDEARQQEPLALLILNTFSAYIGLACSHIANILDPDRIIIGGGIAAAGELLLSAINENYERHVFPKAKDKEVLTLATLGNDAGILGAAYLVLSSQKG